MKSSASPRRRRVTRRPAVALAAALLLLTGCARVPGLYVAEKDGASASVGAGDGPFDPTSYAAGVWDSKVVPTVTAKAVDAKTLVAALKSDATGAATTYGVRSASGGTFFMIKGTGKIVSVEDPQGAGELTVDVTGDGKADLGVAIGPVFLGTALRDAVGFITFGQFTNQIDYSSAAAALNARVRTTVVASLDRTQLTGKSVNFVGAFHFVDPDHLVITPVRCDVTS